MKTRTVILTVMCMLLLSVPVVAQTTPTASEKLSETVVIRFNAPDEATVIRFLTPDYDVAAYMPGKFLDIVSTRGFYMELLSEGYDVEITQTDKQMRDNLEKKSRKKLQGYRDYETLVTELQGLETQYPSIVKLYDLGAGWGAIYSDAGKTNYDTFRHHLWAVKVSDNVAVEEDEPSVYYMGEHHAREPLTLEMTMTVLNHILTNYGSDATITERVDNAQIWFIPLVNPDGHQIVIDEQDVWWRKNIRDNNTNDQFDVVTNQYGNGPDGVDINRNYSYLWGLVGASDDPNNVTYHGPEPASEPETTIIENFISSHYFQAGISYHTYSELVIYPYGYDYNVIPPDVDAMKELAEEMAVTIPGTSFDHGHYDPGPAWGLYPTTGDLDDYSYGNYGVFSYTIEMATEFIPPAEEIDQICQDNLQAAMILLNRPFTSTVTGHITDADTGDPLVGEIIVEGIDDESWKGDDRYPDKYEFRYPYKSEATYGRYYRLLTDGTYNITYWAPGYTPVTHSVTVTDTGQTVQDVSLSKSQCPVNNTACASIFSGIEGGSVFIPLSGENVDSWEITYNGQTESVSRHKTMYRLSGITSSATDVIITAKGTDTNGASCDDTETCTLTIAQPSQCPSIDIDTASFTDLSIGQSTSIPLNEADVDIWEVTYDSVTSTLPGQQASHTIDLVGDATTVYVTANGFDDQGGACNDEVEIPLDFADPTSGTGSLNPAGPYAAGDKVTVSIQTTNAVMVTLSDGLTIDAESMTPNADENETYANIWTFEYTVFMPVTLTATIYNPNMDSITYDWNIEVSTALRTVSGTVADASTGWPLYAEVAYGPAITWTDPVTGQYQLQMPDAAYDVTATAWVSGYEPLMQSVTATGETTLNFNLQANQTDCYTPGYDTALLFEPFDGCTVPEGWTITDNAGSDAVWAVYPPEWFKNYTGGKGCYIISDSDYAGEVWVDTSLITPTVDCSGLGNVTVSFKYDFYTYTGMDYADVDVSVDGGANWTTVWHQSGNLNDSRDPQSASIDISAQAAGQSAVKVRFRHYNAFYEWWWMIDDIRIYDSSSGYCGTPTTGGLVVGNVSDAESGEDVTGALISAEDGTQTLTAPTSDENVGDGFYVLYLDSGLHTLSVGDSVCGFGAQDVNVTDSSVSSANLIIDAPASMANLIRTLNFLNGEVIVGGCPLNADVTGNGTVGPEDPIMMMQELAGITRND